MRVSHQTASFALVGLALLGCAPAVKQAGHTLQPEQESSAPSVSATTHLSGSASENAPAPAPDVSKSQPNLAAPAPVPQGGRIIGRPGGIALEAMSESGHWVVTCQRADGRELDMPTSPRGVAEAPVQLELFLGEQAERIDDLLASDPDGRYLVILQGAEAWLLDGVEDSRWSLAALSPDLRADRLPEHRSFAFSDTHLVVLSTSDEAPAFALPLPHLLDTEVSPYGYPGSALAAMAQPVQVGPRPIYRVEAGIGHARFITLTEGSSERSWPVPATRQPVRRCASPTRPFAAFGEISRYRPVPGRETAWLPLPSPTANDPPSLLVAEAAPGFVMASGDSWVRRLDTGRVLLVREGTQRQLTSARCGSRIVHGYGPNETFLVACEEYEPVAKRRRSGGGRQPKFRFDLYLIRPGFVKSLGADVARTGVDVIGHPVERYVPIRPGANAALVDFSEQRLVEFDGDARIVAVGHERALIRRGNELSLFIGPGRSEENVDLDVDSLDPVLTRGSVAAVGAQVFSLAEQVRSWRLPRPPLALSKSGHALLANEPSSPGRWPRGPYVLIGPGSPDEPPESEDPPREP